MQTRREELRILQREHELPAATANAPNRGWTDPANPASPTLASPNSPGRCSSCLPSTDLEMGRTSDCSLPSALVTHHAPWTIPLLSLTSTPTPIWIQVTQAAAHHFPSGSLQGSHTLTLGFLFGPPEVKTLATLTTSSGSYLQNHSDQKNFTITWFIQSYF